ncbi:MAG: hypothetical protein CVT83_08020 [Alphaproteobacteria bacterium HGW-Alphaproteobacteria-5]|jgi:hypothetical protein|nr:MAG: hypothetical protein CVT83_08020 [Alphaproteobacteria bacterium HGW-Alphaproteobacteria-5]
MAENGPPDFLQAYRDMLGTWEKMANDFGSKFLQQKEAAQAMNGLATARVAVQAQMRDGMLKALDAIQMPSKADIEDLGARLGAIEAAVARIETQLAAGGKSAAPAAPGPARTRKPPARGAAKTEGKAGTKPGKSR